MEFKQIYTPGIAHCSYIVGGKNSCIIIDPARDISQYIETAASWGLKITTIIETHLHADFISGHIELLEKTGAEIYITQKANAQFKHKALYDGEEFTIDTLSIKMLDTPGHTPDCAVFLVSDLERGKEPVLAFTGDTLLVGDAGRPDLFPEIKESLAKELYSSLKKIKMIGDNVELYPAHGAGSLCGRSLSSKLSSTIGTEKIQNYVFKFDEENKFVQSFLHDMPEVPDHFLRCSEINRKGPALISSMPKIQAYGVKEFFHLSQSGYSIVDTRDMLSFSSAHMPGAYGLSLMGNLSTFAGWVLPADKPILLVLPSEKDFDNVKKALYRVGLDNIDGYLSGGMASYIDSGLPLSGFESISAYELKEKLDKNEITLIDARLKSEYEQYHINEAINIPAPDMRTRYNEIPIDKPVAFICSSGVRAMLAASIMQKNTKRKDILNVVGGMSAWVNSGF